MTYEEAFPPKIVKLMEHYGFMPTSSGGDDRCYCTDLALCADVRVYKDDSGDGDGPPLTEDDPVIVDVNIMISKGQLSSKKGGVETLITMRFKTLKELIERLDYIPMWDMDKRRAKWQTNET